MPVQLVIVIVTRLFEKTPPLLKVTGLLEPPPVAETLKLVPKTAVAGACWVIVIAWLAFCAVTVSEIGRASWKERLSAWEAVNVQVTVPLVIVTVLPEVEQ